MGVTENVRATRSDAIVNRERVLAAAAGAFRVNGLDASVNTIARTAGVGIGTLYRHFPTKEVLLAEVLSDQLDELVLVSQQLCAAEDREAAHAFAGWIAAVSKHIGGFAAAANWVEPALIEDDRLRALCLQVSEHGAQLLDRAVSAGGASSAISIDDVIASVVLLSKSATPSDPDRPRRLVDLLIQGVLVGPGAGS